MKKHLLLLFLLLCLLSCKDNYGETSTQEINNSGNMDEQLFSVNDLLKIKDPKPEQTVSSPLKLKGEARGYWFFEADAPVELINEDFQLMAEGYISAKGEWMTEDWVPFEGTLQFPLPPTPYGFLIFHKANPSGLEENAMSDTLKVIFSN